MKIIKCNTCKLDAATCNHECITTDDVSTLYKEGMTQADAFKGFCTNHSCEHNPSGFKCTLEQCIHKLT